MAYEVRRPTLGDDRGLVAVAPPVAVNALATPPAQPVHTLRIQGTSDTLLPHEGGSNTINFPIGPITLDYLGAQASIEKWAQFNGCRSIPSLKPLRIRKKTFTSLREGESTSRVRARFVWRQSLRPQGLVFRSILPCVTIPCSADSTHARKPFEKAGRNLC